jgi:hypothetical protein
LCYAVLLRTSLRPIASLSFAKSRYLSVTVSISGLVSPWDTLTLQDLASPTLNATDAVSFPTP